MIPTEDIEQLKLRVSAGEDPVAVAREYAMDRPRMSTGYVLGLIRDKE